MIGTLISSCYPYDLTWLTLALLACIVTCPSVDELLRTRTGISRALVGIIVIIRTLIAASLVPLLELVVPLSRQARSTSSSPAARHSSAADAQSTTALPRGRSASSGCQRGVRCHEAEARCTHADTHARTRRSPELERDRRSTGLASIDVASLRVTRRVAGCSVPLGFRPAPGRNAALPTRAQGSPLCRVGPTVTRQHGNPEVATASGPQAATEAGAGLPRCAPVPGPR